MTEPEDLMIQGISALHNGRAIDVPSAPDQATAEAIAVRLSELRLRPVPGAYDSSHLQQIHARIYQDLFPWAGQFRASESSSSLDTLFDRLARANRLKGLDPDVWSKRSTEYFTEIVAIEPFAGGTELASLEFFRKLAIENNMALRWSNAVSEPSHEEMQSQLQQAQGYNLRRILMLAVDPYPTAQPSRVLESRNILELITPT
jgi:cell filamentation protein